jgi:hypothetical protein
MPREEERLLAVGSPFNPMAGVARYPFVSSGSPTGGTHPSGRLFLDPARACPLLGRPALPRSAQQACGPPCFFRKTFLLLFEICKLQIRISFKL